MPNFRYLAFDLSGNREEGVSTFPNEMAAIEDLAAKKLTVVDIAEIQDIYSPNFYRRTKLSISEEANVAEQLASLLAAAIPTLQIVQIISTTSPNLKVKNYFNRIGDFLSEGVTLPQALERVPDLFSARFLAIAKFAHKSQSPVEVYRTFASDLRRQAKLISEIRNAAIYPTILVFMSILIIALMAFVLAPQLESVFDGYADERPFSLSLFSAIREFVTSPITWLLALIGVCSIYYWTTYNELTFKILLHRLPYIGNALLDIDAAEIARTTNLLLHAGEGLADALTVVAATFPNNGFAAATATAAESVINGGSASEVFETELYLSPMFRQLFSLAEKTNRFSDILPTLAATLENTSELRIRRAMQMLSPSLTLGLGLFIGLLVFSIMSSILSINDVVL
jgi:general secretion pathway protein F